MELKDNNGMTMISSEDLRCLHSLKHLFKDFRNTVAFTHAQSREGENIENLVSKMWRLSDKILDELKKVTKKGGKT